jgi:hypothetical protein
MARSKTTEIAFDEWRLDTPDDMFDALKEVLEYGYRGQVRVWPQSGELTWDLTLNLDGQLEIHATFGHILVRVGSAPLELLTPEQYAAKGYED